MIMKFALSGVLAVVLAAAPGVLAPAHAADSPKLVGTWKPAGDDQASVRFGTANEHYPKQENAAFGNPAHRWTVVVDTQEGRAFHGHSLSPQGSKVPMVGVVRHDGRHLVIATATGEVQGEFVGDKLELCWVDHLPGRASVSCELYAK